MGDGDRLAHSLLKIEAELVAELALVTPVSCIIAKSPNFAMTVNFGVRQLRRAARAQGGTHRAARERRQSMCLHGDARRWRAAITGRFWAVA